MAKGHTNNNVRVMKHPLASRLYHWCLILGFLPAALTGFVLWLKVGGEDFVNLAMRIHILGASLFSISTLVYCILCFDRVVAFLQHVFSWSKNDIEWMKVSGGYPQKILFGKEIPVPPMGKLNSGQKMMSIFMLYGGAFLLISGWVLYAFIPFTPKEVVYWLDFGHLWIGLFLGMCSLAHIGLGVYNQVEFKSMFGDGTVSLADAEHHNPEWVKHDIEPVGKAGNSAAVSG